MPLDLSMPKTITSENERKKEDMKEVQSKAKGVDKTTTERDTQAFDNSFIGATDREVSAHFFKNISYKGPSRI